MIILSFVVQNYPTQHFMPKTKRYKDIVRLYNLNLLLFLVKINLLKSTNILINLKKSYHLSNLHYQYFTLSFWKFFKRSFSLKFGTVTSNLTKTASYLTYFNLLHHFNLNYKNNSVLALPNISTIYFQENTLIPFSFQSKTYNTIMFFIITLLVSFYLPTQIEFKLFYSYIWRSRNLVIYDFLNHFYFKLKNY